VPVEGSIRSSPASFVSPSPLKSTLRTDSNTAAKPTPGNAFGIGISWAGMAPTEVTFHGAAGMIGAAAAGRASIVLTASPPQSSPTPITFAKNVRISLSAT
jgi:hypothetical protein